MKNLKNIIRGVSFVLSLFMVFNVSGQTNGSRTGENLISIDYDNPDNPYDDTGIKHNEIVMEFLKRYGNERLAIQKTLDLTNELCDEHELKGERLTLKQFNYGVSDIKNSFSGTVEKSNLSYTGKIELQRLLDFIVSNGFKGGIDLEEVVIYIKDFESSIMKNRELTESDKTSLLQLSSVGRHSVGMWYKIYNSPTAQKIAEKRTPGWLRWLVVGAADVAGGVAGGGAFSVATGVAASTTTNTFISTVDKEK
ncbi:hypothetical protein [Nonlabens sp.]|uniref:hypothetical protein n=1 Tax=Nonlabens sp. TaxID=1888209 RepID=UPI001BCF20D4|nr:hypothetical protein [Nonlabens sp.]